MEPTREIRVAEDVWPETDFEIRAASSDGMTFDGYAAVFNSWSQDLGGFREKIEYEAFDQTLRERGTVRPGGGKPIKAFQNHNWDIVLGSTYEPVGREQTLHLSIDEKGLKSIDDLPDNEWGRPVRDGVLRGDISSMSFGFNVVRDEWNDDKTERRVIEVRLWEVSPVTAWPAYEGTSTSVRKLAKLSHTDSDELDDAVRVLFSEDELDDTQHELLLRAINARYHSPVADAFVAEMRERTLAKRPDWLE